MKFFLLAALPWAATANNCTLHGGFANLEVTCSIPSATMISSTCCKTIQDFVDKAQADPHFQPSPEEQQAAQMNCMSLAMYVMLHAPQGPQPTSQVEEVQHMIDSFPDGLTCTEKIKGAAETTCVLQAEFGKLGVNCKIPNETAITPQCCRTLQRDIDLGMEYLGTLSPPENRLVNEANAATMSDCQEFFAWAKQRSPQIPAGASAAEKAKMVINSIPAGESCTQAISGGDMMSLFANHTIISKIALAAGVRKHISDELNAMPFVASGIAGFLAGGLFVAGALVRYSTKRHDNQYSLLA